MSATTSGHMISSALTSITTPLVSTTLPPPISRGKGPGPRPPNTPSVEVHERNSARHELRPIAFDVTANLVARAIGGTKRVTSQLCVPLVRRKKTQK
jgi:hypothetical protein